MAFGMNFFRRYQGRLLLALGVFLMVIWSVGGSLARWARPEPVAGKAFGEKVSLEEFAIAERTVQILRLGMETTRDDVWEFVVLSREADRYGIQVSDEEVTEGLRSWVAGNTGANAENLDAAYRSILAENRGLSDSILRAAIRKRVMIAKLQSAIAVAGIPSDAAAWQRYRKDGLQVRVKTLTVPSAGFTGAVEKPAPEELTAYYEENISRYATGQRAVVQYAAAFSSEYGKLFPVTDDEIAEYYEEHKAEDYTLAVELESTSSQIEGLSLDSTGAAALEVDADAAAEEAEQPEPSYRPLEEVTEEIRATLSAKKAEEIINDAKIEFNYHKDWSLEQVAGQYGLPFFETAPFAADDPVKLMHLQDAIVPDYTPIMEAIFPTPPQRGVVVETPEGLFLWTVTSMEEPRQKEFDEVAQEIESELLLVKAGSLAMEKAAELLKDLEASGWEKFAGGEYPVAEPAMAGDLAFEELTQAAMEVETGDFGGPVLGPDGAYIFEMLERREPTIAEFDMFKLQIKQMYAAQDVRAFLEDWRDDLMKRADIQKEGTYEDEEPADS